MAARPYLRLADPERDRHIRRGGEEYTHAFLSLLPMGQAWPKAWDCGSDSLLYRVHRGLAWYWGFVDGRAADLLERESDPRKTIELLPDWERAWGLPDPCFPDATTIQERQKMLVLYMTYLGGQSRDYYEKLMEWLGIKIQIKEFAPFMAGISRAGDTRPLARIRYDFVCGDPETIYGQFFPTTRDDGSALRPGDVWVHEITGVRNQWDGSAWFLIDPPIAAGSVSVATIKNENGVYDPGTHTFTYTTPGPLIVDGVELKVNQRVLLVNQTTATENGIYVLTDVGNSFTVFGGPDAPGGSEDSDSALFSFERVSKLTRSQDFNNGWQFYNGMTIAVSRGATQANTTWQLTALDPVTLDSTDLTFRSINPLVLRQEVISPACGWVPRFAAGAVVVVDGRTITVRGSYNSLRELQEDHPVSHEGEGFTINGNLYIWFGVVFVEVQAVEAPDVSVLPPVEEVDPPPTPPVTPPEEPAAPGVFVTEELWAVEGADTAAFTETISNKWISVGPISNITVVSGSTVPAPNKVDDNFRWYIGDPHMRFYWSASVGHPQLTWFRSGASRAGENHHLRIGIPEDTQCLLNRWKPAHTGLVMDFSHMAWSGPMQGTP